MAVIDLNEERRRRLCQKAAASPHSYTPGCQECWEPFDGRHERHCPSWEPEPPPTVPRGKSARTGLAEKIRHIAAFILLVLGAVAAGIVLGAILGTLHLSWRIVRARAEMGCAGGEFVVSGPLLNLTITAPNTCPEPPPPADMIIIDDATNVG